MCTNKNYTVYWISLNVFKIWFKCFLSLKIIVILFVSIASMWVIFLCTLCKLIFLCTICYVTGISFSNYTNSCDVTKPRLIQNASHKHLLIRWSNIRCQGVHLKNPINWFNQFWQKWCQFMPRLECGLCWWIENSPIHPEETVLFPACIHDVEWMIPCSSVVRAALAKAQKDPDKSNGCFCWRTHFNWHSKPKPITLDAELYFPDGSSCSTTMYYGQKWADVVSRFAYASLLSQCDWSIHDIKSLFLLCAVFRVGGISRGGFATYLQRIHFVFCFTLPICFMKVFD